MSGDDFIIPEDWTAEDLIDHINLTLNKPNIRSVELFRKDGNIILRTHRNE